MRQPRRKRKTRDAFTPPTVSATADSPRRVVSASARSAPPKRPPSVGSPEGDALLCDARRGWLVEEGSVDLFVVELQAGHAVAWEPVGQIGAGGLLVGTPVLDEAGLVARTAPGARLSGVWLDDVDDEFDGGPEAVAAWLDTVLRQLGSTLEAGRRNKLEHLAAADNKLDLEIERLQSDGQIQRLSDVQIGIPPSGASWVTVRSGAIRVLGEARDARVTEGQTVPVGDADWLIAEGTAALRLDPTSEIVADGAIAYGLKVLSTELIQANVRHLRRAEESERARQDLQAERDEQTIDSAVAELRTVFDGEVHDLGRIAQGAAYVAVRIAARDLGQPVRVPRLSANYGPKVDAVARVASASGIRMRSVTLDGTWWRRDHGPMVGALKEGSVPVALTRSRFGYRLHDPTAVAALRITPAEAARLKVEAQELYSPLPAGRLGLRELMRFSARGAGGDLRTMAAAATAVALLGLLTPILTGVVLGRLVPRAQDREIGELCALLVVGAFVSAGLTIVFNLAALRLEGRTDYRVQSGVWDRILSLPSRFFRGYSTGELSTAVLGVSQTREVLAELGFQAVLAAFVVLCDMVLIAVLDLRLLLVALVVPALGVLVTVYAGRRLLVNQTDTYAAEQQVNSRTYQLINGVGKITAAGASARAFNHWAQAFARQRRGEYATRQVENRLAAFNACFLLAGTLCAFFAVDQLFHVPTSTFLIFIVAYFQVLAALQQVSAAVVLTLEIVPTLQSLGPVLDEAPETGGISQDPGRLSGRVEFDDVHFGYRDGATVLDGVSFSVRPGEFVAVVGASGSGKSTLVRLLLGFDAPWDGAIRYDGQDLVDLDATSVRRQCGVVLQDAQLFSGSILTNITGVGLYGYDDGWEAARLCGLEETISAMPMGIYTMISDAGAGISGGQQQRILLARALVTRPRIVILDEATSALDNATQRMVMDSISQLKATRIVIAHRLSTIQTADRIVVLDAGQVVQSGTFDELMGTDGIFRDLARRQLV